MYYRVVVGDALSYQGGARSVHNINNPDAAAAAMLQTAGDGRHTDNNTNHTKQAREGGDNSVTEM